MKRTSVTLGVLAAAMLLQGSNSIYAQSTGGDEQGLSIPAEVSLPQDRIALTEARDGWWTDARKNYDERMGWYNDAKFGCFIHWGVYSDVAGFWHGKHIGGYTEHLMRKATIPLDVYRKEVVAPFNPTGFDADEWMSHARDAGMKYFIVTAKHHDGFAMFPSDAYPYDIRQTTFDRDPMGELREAARRYGIKFGFYYSHAFDWEHPDAPGNDWDYDNPGGDRLLGGAEWWTGGRRDFLPKAEKYVAEKSIPQIQELIRNYQPDILWFDTPAKLPLYLNVRILKAIREADPENKIVVNGRLARYGGSNLGDYRNTGDRAAFFFPTEGPWESIPTTNESYGYSIEETKGGDYDFVIADDYILELVISEGLAQKLDTAKLENYGNLNPVFMSQFYDLQNEYTVPYGAGIPLIVYDPSLTEVEITGYEDLWNPALKDNVAITANYRVINGITLKIMGESFNTEDLNTIQAAGDKLLELAPNIRVINDSNTQDYLVSGEVAAAFLYTSQVYTALNARDDLKVVYPKEGLGFGIMAGFIPSDAPNAEAAYAFIDYINRPENAAACFEYIGFYCTNQAAEEAISDEMRELIVLPKDAAEGEIVQNVSQEAEDLHAEIWNQFKAACD